MSDLLKGVRSRLDTAIERARTEADRQHAQWQAAVAEHDRLVAARDLIDGKTDPRSLSAPAASTAGKHPKKTAKAKSQQRKAPAGKKRPKRHKSGLGRVQAIVLEHVLEHPGLPAAKISQATGTGPSAYSAIKGLADSGLLVEAGTDGDGRATYKAAGNAENVLNGTSQPAKAAPAASSEKSAAAKSSAGTGTAAAAAKAATES
jgi:hypothetical protein